MRKKIGILLLFFLVLPLLSGCGLKPDAPKMAPVTLNYWRVFDGPEDFGDLLANYKKLHPYVTINYKKLRYEEYEDELKDAMAEDRGPDIFSIQNTWVRNYQKKIKPMPASVKVTFMVQQGTIKKEMVPEAREVKSLSLRDIKNNFADVVYNDVVVNTPDPSNKNGVDMVYGLPLAIDTLAMYYNKDLLNNSGITQPPAYWNKDFQQAVKKMTKQDASGQIVQSGVALGGSENIQRSTDILSALMMQNGADMMSDNVVAFDKVSSAFTGQNYHPGTEALRFYTDFANPAKEVYCWNDKLEDSLKMFTEGKLAFMFGYAYHKPTIVAQAPKLNFDVAKLPQIEGNTPINFANYWVETVSNKTKHADEAWDFVQYITKADQAKVYLNKTKKPAALRSLIDSQVDDQDIGVFASQVLTAKSWYKGYDAVETEKIMGEMIDQTVLGKDKISDVISLAAGRVSQTISPPKN